jgi:hypothetical protein
MQMHLIILLFLPLKFSCNKFYFIYFIRAIPYGHINNIIYNPIHTCITLIKLMQMQWIILLLCNTLMPKIIYFTSFDSKMKLLDYLSLMQYHYA